ncbi:RcnB family protein [Lysobacter cavernae]|uniref:RcnB family protein n=1 Tax=Lysobacter cavernae TaxID=1685901 RepID=A0ABV7RMQ6_9GAMM
MKRLLSAVLLGFVFLSPVTVLAKGKGKHHDDSHHHDDRHDDDHDDDERGHPRGKHKGWHKQEYRRGVVYEERRYYVDDYRHYHLNPPPRGHRWVRSNDGKYILIAVATGIIADILLHH